MGTTDEMARIRQFSCLQDNFGVLVHLPESGRTIAFDVPEAAPYLKALADTGWTLTDILITHHHFDHVQGLEALKAGACGGKSDITSCTSFEFTLYTLILELSTFHLVIWLIVTDPVAEPFSRESFPLGAEGQS